MGEPYASLLLTVVSLALVAVGTVGLAAIMARRRERRRQDENPHEEPIRHRGAQ